MKILMFAFMLVAGSLFADPYTQINNYNQNHPARAFMPAGTPSYVQVWVSDPASTAEFYFVTLTYRTYQGEVGKLSQIVKRTGPDTLLYFFLDVPEVEASAQVVALGQSFAP